MGTLYETICATPQVLEACRIHFRENNRAAMEVIRRQLPVIREIILIGSGSSLNEAKSARGFLEQVTRRRVTTETSNDFMYNHTVFDREYLYVFLSQSGTSQTTRQAQRKVREQGCTTIAISSCTDRFLAAEADAVVDSQAAHEEYLCVTMGFCASLATLMLFGLSLAELLGTLDRKQTEAIAQDLQAAADHYPTLTSMTTQWFTHYGDQVMKARYYAVYGSDDLWGVALEGALKILEIPKLFAVGYELEDGMHGPTMAFDENICLLILDGNDRERDRAESLARFSKAETKNGFLIGPKGLDKSDLQIQPVSRYFQNIEYACVLQTICWWMSVAAGVDLTQGRGVGHSSKKYFSTHSEADLK